MCPIPAAPPQDPSSAVPAPTAALEDCLRLLRGDRDEQKLAGLMLAAKLCAGADAAAEAAVAEVYSAVGPRFLRRLLVTGMGKGVGPEKREEEREAYLRLAVTVLAAFARVPAIASSDGLASAVPLVAEVVLNSLDLSLVEEGLVFLLFVATASDGSAALIFHDPGVIQIGSRIIDLPDGSTLLQRAVQFVQLLVHKFVADSQSIKNSKALSDMVVVLANLFGTLHNSVKFDAMHMLRDLLSFQDVDSYSSLVSAPDAWAAHIRVGITAVLQNRLVSSIKLEALLLADRIMLITGEAWLLANAVGLDKKYLMTLDKFVLLLLESARVEVAVLLNELAYTKYELSKNSSNVKEAFNEKQQYLAITFSVIKRIIKMIANASEEDDNIINEGTISKAICGLNETTNLVLDYLQDAKDHKQRKGDDLLAAVRVIGSYLAETPFACHDRIRDMMEFILSVEGQDEPSPFYSICFMLPMLSQITAQHDWSMRVISFGAHRMIIDYLVRMIEINGTISDDAGDMLLACDAISNILSTTKHFQGQIDHCFITLLQVLVPWAGNRDEQVIIMTTSSLCMMILDLTSEETLLRCSGFNKRFFDDVSRLIIRSLEQGKSGEENDEYRRKVIISGYKRWAARYPLIRDAVEHALKLGGC